MALKLLKLRFNNFQNLFSLTREISEKKDLEQIHLCEVSLRRRREGSENGERILGKDLGQIHLCEVSLRRRRETSGMERLEENTSL